MKEKRSLSDAKAFWPTCFFETLSYWKVEVREEREPPDSPLAWFRLGHIYYPPRGSRTIMCGYVVPTRSDQRLPSFMNSCMSGSITWGCVRTCWQIHQLQGRKAIRKWKVFGRVQLFPQKGTDSGLHNIEQQGEIIAHYYAWLLWASSSMAGRFI